MWLVSLFFYGPTYYWYWCCYHRWEVSSLLIQATSYYNSPIWSFWVTFSAFVESAYTVLCPKLLILVLIRLYGHSLLFFFFFFLSLSSFLLSLLSSMFSYLIYGTGIPGIALVGFCLYFSDVLAFDLCFSLCLFSLPASQKQIWNFVVKITFVFQCSWYVLSPNLPVS